MKKHNFRSLQIWRSGIDLAGKVYDFSRGLPDEEKFGLRSQMTRAGVSVSSNIAEGSARSNRSFRQFLRISLGSCYELETQMIVCQQQSFGDQKRLSELIQLVQEEQKMITKFYDNLPILSRTGNNETYLLSFGLFLLGLGSTMIRLAMLT